MPSQIEEKSQRARHPEWGQIRNQLSYTRKENNRDQHAVRTNPQQD
jgi:hypothetical protein